jgi:cellulose synthase/poly-beta-1,6-N-acetylglucosamine synthase-like glycosyltransferase
MTVQACDVSVVISTYNRCASLRTALDALVAQTGTVPHEIIVVDNNSTDRTASLVHEYVSACPGLVRYVFEKSQGLPYARNAGIIAAEAPLIAFTDDDVCVAADWVESIKRAFDAHPEVDVLGGRVLPRWNQAPPPWFSKKLLAPLALQDKGDVPMRVDAANAAPCLIGANFAFRRAVFDRVGLFDPAYIRGEDREIQLRVWRAGGLGLYVPAIMTWVDVPAERLTKTYFRQWHANTGAWGSRMRLLDLIGRDGAIVPERNAQAPHLFGAPAFLYRQLLQHLRRWTAAALRRDQPEAFYEECRFRYIAAYLRERYREFTRSRRPQRALEMARFVQTLGRRAGLRSAVRRVPL